MKSLKYKILYLFAFGALASCSEYTDGINESPNSFVKAPGNLLIGQANLSLIKLSESQSSRLSGMWTDQFTGDDRQYLSLNNYVTKADEYDDEWGDLYSGLAQAQLVEQEAIATVNPILEGVAKIMQAALLGEAAALWGDVPASEASDYAKFPNPKYDSQASVFAYVQNLLTAGISKVGTTAVATAYGTGFTGGARWDQVAHSLKARYYLVTKNYPMALTSAQAGIPSPTAELRALHTTAAGARNMYYQFAVEQRAGYLSASGPSNLHKLLSGVRPRLLATPGDANRRTVYFSGATTNLNTSATGYFGIAASFPIVSYVETKLIEAEAAQRVAGDVGAPGLAAFTAVRNHLATLYAPGVFPASTATGIALTNQILEEKYISLIGSLQVFHDARRTNNVLGIPLKSSTATTLPQRFLYPQTEIGSNSNYPGSVDLFTKTPVN